MNQQDIVSRPVRRRWNEEEDKYLLEQTSQFQRAGKAVNWTEIARGLKHRSNKDCRKRYIKISPQFSKGAWQADEDARLRQAVMKLGGRWKAISDCVQTRSPDQCAKRWRNSLDPALVRSVFTPEEDMTLRRAVEQHGRNWKIIHQKYLPSRSRLDLSNRYTVLHRKTLNSNWTTHSRSPSECSSDSTQSTHSPHTPINDTNTSPRHVDYSWAQGKMHQQQLPVTTQGMMPMNNVDAHSHMQQPSMASLHEVKPPTWGVPSYSAAEAAPTSYLPSQHQAMPQHMAYPSYYSETAHGWMEQKRNDSIPAGYPTSMADSQSSVVETSPQPMIKMEPTYSSSPHLQQQNTYASPQVPLPSSMQSSPQQIHHSPARMQQRHTIQLDGLDPSHRAAILGSLVDSKRQVTLVLE